MTPSWFQSRYLKEYTGQHSVERCDGTLFAGDNAEARLACSDHRPVWIAGRVPNKDDD
jgi:hypothetical protein